MAMSRGDGRRTPLLAVIRGIGWLRFLASGSADAGGVVDVPAVAAGVRACLAAAAG